MVQMLQLDLVFKVFLFVMEYRFHQKISIHNYILNKFHMDLLLNNFVVMLNIKIIDLYNNLVYKLNKLYLQTFNNLDHQKYRFVYLNHSESFGYNLHNITYYMFDNQDLCIFHLLMSIVYFYNLYKILSVYHVLHKDLKLFSIYYLLENIQKYKSNIYYYYLDLVLNNFIF